MAERRRPLSVFAVPLRLPLHGTARARGCAGALGLSLALLAGQAQAGAQREEALSDAVRLGLQAAITQQAPPQPPHTDAAQASAFEAWLAQAQQALHTRLRPRASAARSAPTGSVPAHELDAPALQREFLQTVWYESRRAGLSPSLVLGLIEVESGFRKFAISSAGARGYMQVMPFWPRQLVGTDGAELFHTQANLRYGCVILRHYLDREQGDLVLALGRYNGSRGQRAYPDAVLAAQKKWARSAGPID